jgi:hypothetical protein
MRIQSHPYKIQAGRPDLLPLCDLHVIGPKGRVLQRIVFDSGAEFPIFPRRAADDAGIMLPSAPNSWVQFGGSIAQARRHPTYLELDGHRWAVDVWFVDRLELPYALLGRRGVFSQFNEVAFIERIRQPRVELRW